MSYDLIGDLSLITPESKEEGTRWVYGVLLGKDGGWIDVITRQDRTETETVTAINYGGETAVIIPPQGSATEVAFSGQLTDRRNVDIQPKCLILSRRHFKTNNNGWHTLLKTASTYGWKAAGTLSPAIFYALVKPGKFYVHSNAWDGDYFGNDFQTVTAQDAANLADAVEGALADHSNPMNPLYVPDKNGDTGINNEKYQASIREFINFCRQGEFVIS